MEPQRSRKRQSLRHRISLVTASAALAVAAVQSLLVLAVSWGIAESQTQSTLAAAQRQFSSFLDQEDQDLAWNTATTLEWNVVRDYLRTRGPGGPPEELDNIKATDQGLDGIALTDLQGKVLWSSVSPALTPQALAEKAAFLAAALAAPPRDTPAPDDETDFVFKTFFDTSAVPLRCLGGVVFTQDVGGTRLGTVVCVRYLGPKVLEKFTSISGSSAGFRPGPRKPGEEHGQLAVYLPVSDQRDDPAGFWRVAVTDSRPQVVWSLSGFLIPLGLLSSAVLYAAINRYLRRRVVGPLLRVRDYLEGFRDTMEHPGQLAFAYGDELDDLAHHAELMALRVVEQTAALDRLAATDGLTGLANRRRMDAVLGDLAGRGEAPGQRAEDRADPLAFVLIDVDFFKRYNDRCGHAAGDEVLRAVARALRGAVRGDRDLVCRYGGEEFALVLAGTDLPGALAVADRARQAVFDLNLPHPDSDCADRVTLSAGAAAVARAGFTDPPTLISRADEALYRAKRTGRNRVEGQA